MVRDDELIESSSIEVIQKDSAQTLDGYYSVRLRLTGDMEDDLDKLQDYYVEKMSDKVDPYILRDTLHEYISLFNSRGLQGSEVVAEKISMVSRKSSRDKKNLSYLIGCLRHILEHGVSSTGSQTERRLIKSFEDVYGHKLSANGVHKLLQMATRNSTTEVLFTIMENTIDVEELIIEKFECLLLEGRDRMI